MFNYGHNIAEILILFLAVLISIILHELAHGYVALWNGDATAKVKGRLTLNPLAHFDIIGFFMLITVGFGYAKPVPVNPYNFKHQKRGIFTVAIAGITLNLILAFASSGLMTLFYWLANTFPGGGAVLGYFQSFFYVMVMVNLGLFFFNLLPIHPLDGFRIIESFTRYNNKVVQFFRNFGQYFLLALVGMSIITDIFHLPIWCDPLGAYIEYAQKGVFQLFGAFWGLFLKL